MLPSLKKLQGHYSMSALMVRIAGLSLFAFIHPFPAAVINEFIDAMDTYLSPLINGKKTTGNINYQFPDKCLDFILYIGWLLIPIFQDKWFGPLLVYATLFRGIGIYLFLKTEKDKYLTLFPNIFLYWFFLFYGLEYFNIRVSSSVLGCLLLACILLKVIHEDILRGKLSKIITKMKNTTLANSKWTKEQVWSAVFASVIISFFTIFRTKKLFKAAI